MQQILDIIDKIGVEHPYKIYGIPETYSTYNEGWCDACDRIAGEIENYLKDKTIINKDQLMQEIKNSSKKMSETKPPHKYYKAISTNKIIELLKEK